MKFILRSRKLSLVICCLLSLAFLTTQSITAQKRKPVTAKKPIVKKEKKAVLTIVEGVGSAGGSSYKIEPYLSLEPCAKETPEQISELENAPDKNKQVEILLKRISEKDDWLRSCAIFRLGEFRSEAKDALPQIIKLLHDEENNDVWSHVETALWKIPPDSNTSLKERIKLSQNENVYLKIYGVYSLSYFRPVANTFQSKETLAALIENVEDEDVTVSWLAVMGIRQLGFYGVDTSDSISVLSKVLQAGKINPIHPVRAFVPMGEKALPAAPLLFDVLYNPKKYAGKDEDNARSYGLYLTTAIALGKIGKPLLPLLEKELKNQPFAVIEVLGNLVNSEVLPLFFQAMKHENPKVRKKSIERLPFLTSIGAVETIPQLLVTMNDVDLGVQEASISKIGSIAKFTEGQSPELRKMFTKQVVPALIKKLNGKQDDAQCYVALTLGDFSEDADVIVPHLARFTKPDKSDYCAVSALYRLGEKGRKFLTKQQIEQQKENEKSMEDMRLDYNNKAKPIKPKVEPKPTPTNKGT